MSFLITFITLIIERFFHWSHLRDWRWLHRYQTWLSRSRLANWPSYALLLISVLPLAILAGIVNSLLCCVLYGVLQLIFGVIVLLYCLGPQNLWVQAYASINELHKEDPRAAVDYAQSAFNIVPPTDSQIFHRSLTSAFFIAAHQRIFAVIFWFTILGPFGAILYRGVTLCAEQSDLGIIGSAEKFKQLLDWIPARIFTFFFALAGNFINVFTIWKKEVKTSVTTNDKLIANSGLAAINFATQQLPEDGSAEQDAIELLDRVFIIMLCLLAILVLIIK